MYSAVDGMAQPFHFAHLSAFARGKAGLVFAEATAVVPEGRITPQCLGIWSDEHAAAIKPIVQFINSMGSVAGIQLAHAGRKASTSAPFSSAGPLLSDHPDSWQVVAPSAIPVGPGFPEPTALSVADIKQLVSEFTTAAKRSVDCGFGVIELHGAHGYLMHSFLSPIANQRTDEYGADLAGRMRFPLEVSRAVREAVGEDIPLFFRISAVDRIEGGWTMDDSVALSKELGHAGIDVIDCSSGGIHGAPSFRVTNDGKPLKRSSARAPGFQVPYAERIKKETSLQSMAVGVIIDPVQAESIISEQQADLVALGREIMYDPFWPLHAAQALNADPDFNMWPPQYKWAVDRREQIRRLNE
ncbi:MAG: 2,4-dienoyl-CoA reductase-like NADH-dependent reductase (Old Yellow Enzyme family) [Granulosicoccus sp.]|jgi:2,4-dienoyl-CoA reductase-like NADH-dependent reductase (Old Yellow Enzyme family)